MSPFRYRASPPPPKQRKLLPKSAHVLHIYVYIYLFLSLALSLSLLLNTSLLAVCVYCLGFLQFGWVLRWGLSGAQWGSGGWTEAFRQATPQITDSRTMLKYGARFDVRVQQSRKITIIITSTAKEAIKESRMRASSGAGEQISSILSVHSACKRNLITSERINIIEPHYFRINPIRSPGPQLWLFAQSFPAVTNQPTKKLCSF